jgi:hypothetical protein
MAEKDRKIIRESQVWARKKISGLGEENPKLLFAAGDQRSVKIRPAD